MPELDATPFVFTLMRVVVRSRRSRRNTFRFSPVSFVAMLDDALWKATYRPVASMEGLCEVPLPKPVPAELTLTRMLDPARSATKTSILALVSEATTFTAVLSNAILRPSSLIWRGPDHTACEPVWLVVFK